MYNTHQKSKLLSSGFELFLFRLSVPICHAFHVGDWAGVHYSSIVHLCYISVVQYWTHFRICVLWLGCTVQRGSFMALNSVIFQKGFPPKMAKPPLSRRSRDFPIVKRNRFNPPAKREYPYICSHFAAMYQNCYLLSVILLDFLLEDLSRDLEGSCNI